MSLLARVLPAGLLAAVILWAAGPGPTAAAEPLRIVYPRVIDRALDPRDDYPLGLLRLALDKAKVDYELAPSERVMEQSRFIVNLTAGQDINVAWFGTSAESEEKLRPIRVPIYRGLLGHRLLIINAADQARFDAVRELEDLRRFTLAQGLGWADTAILRAAGLNVVEARYDNIFGMIESRRIDAFPRGAFEAFAEVDLRQREQPHLAVERGLILYYPFDMFFFTNRKDEALARIIESGLARAGDDGSLKAYFDDHPYIRRVMREANLTGRRRIEIPNASLTPETAAIPDSYWMVPIRR